MRSGDHRGAPAQLVFGAFEVAGDEEISSRHNTRLAWATSYMDVGAKEVERTYYSAPKNYLHEG
jgi:hypothetical protein